MKRNHLLALVAAIVTALALGGFVADRVVTARALRAAIPARPPLDGWPAALVQHIEDYEREARSGANQVAGLAELSHLYHANGFLAEAAQGYRGLLRADANNPRWPHLLAQILTGFGEVAAARPLLERTIALAPDYLPARIRLGDILLKSGHPQAAGAPYAAVLERSPDDPHALLGAARVAMEAGRLVEAEAHLERAVREHPEFQTAWNVLASVRHRTGDVAGATAARAHAVAARRFRDPPDPWVDDLILACYDPDTLGVAATMALNADNRDRARLLLERVLALAPDDTTALRQLGTLFRHTREFTKARPYLERAVALAPDESDNWVQLHLLLHTVGDAAGAARALREGLTRCPTSPALHLEKGRRLKAAGRYDEALAALEESARLRPHETEAFIERAAIFIRLENIAAALAEVRRALAAQPADPFALIMLARGLIMQGNAAEAGEAIAKIDRQVRVPPEDRQMVLDAYRAKFGREP